MAFVLIPGPGDAPTTSEDWDKINNVLVGIGMGLLNSTRVVGSNVKRGSIVYFAGAWYVTDADTAISGTASDYVMLTNTAGVITASFVSSISTVSFNRTWNGWYDSFMRLHIFDEVKAFGAGAISELASMTTWRPANSETAKILSQLNATGWSAILLTTPYASGKTYTIDGAGGGVYNKLMGSFSGTIIKKDNYTNAGTLVILTNGGVVINAISMILYAFNAFHYAMDIQIKEGGTILATVEVPDGETIPITVPIGGTITGSSRTLTVYAKLAELPSIYATVAMTWSLYGNLTITTPTFVDDFAIRRAGFELI